MKIVELDFKTYTYKNGVNTGEYLVVLVVGDKVFQVRKTL